MANGSRRRKRSSQSGVQAIFTATSGRKTRVQLIGGIVAAGVGALAWIMGSLASASSLSTSLLSNLVGFSTLFQSLAIVLVSGGIGLSVYSLAVRKAREDNYRIESAFYELQALVEKETGLSSSEAVTKTVSKRASGHAPHFRISKAMWAAFVEAAFLLIAYAGLVQEYNANRNMQLWVQANFGIVGYALSYSTVLFLLAGLLGYGLFRLGSRFRPLGAE